MSIDTAAQLIDLLRAAQVIKPAVLDQFLAGRQDSDPRRLAQQLVESQLLTTWQAKFLLSGRNRLKIAGYLLRDRTSRDALGDRFLAIHETLARPVELLVLPNNIRQDDRRFQNFLRLSSRLTQLDHPRLAHIYDIGEEGGRFFIVSEQVTPLATADFSPAEVLTEFQRAEIANDWWQALDYLSRQSFGHGRINQHTVVIDEQQRGKIVDLAQSQLHAQVLAPESDLELLEKTQRDRKQMAELIQGLLVASNPVAHVAACQSLLSQLRVSDRANSVEEFWLALGGELKTLVANLRSNETMMNYAPWPGSSPPAASTSAASSTGVPNPIATAAASRKVTTARSHDVGLDNLSVTTNPTARPLKPEPTHRPAHTADFWVRHGLTAFGIVVLMSILGLIWRYNRSPGTDNSNQAVATAKDSSGINQPSGDAQGATLPKGGTNLAERSEPKQSEPTSSTSTAPSEPTALAETASQLAEKLKGDPKNTTSGNEESSTVGSEARVTTDNAGEKMSETKDEAANKSNIKPAPPASSRTDLTPQVSGGKPDPFAVPAANKPTETAQPPNQSNTTANASSPTQPATNTDAASGIDLKTLPLQTLIQPSDTKEIQSLFAWPVNSTVQPKLSLQLPADIAGKPLLYFELTPDSAATNVWQVSLRKKDEAAPAEKIGQFLVENGQFCFQWESALEKNSDANYLINGRLRMAVGDQEHTIALRPTITIEPLQITAESFSVKKQIEVPWMPAGTRVELAELTTHPDWQKTLIDDITVPEKTGRKIDFKILETEQLCWLLLRANIDRKVTLMLDLFSPDSKNPLKPQEFAAAFDQVEQRYAQLVAAQAQAEAFADNAPYGTRTKAREAATDARRNASDYKKIRELAVEFRSLVTDQIDKPLPMRIIYSNEAYSLILAQSGNFSDKVETPKPRSRSDR